MHGACIIAGQSWTYEITEYSDKLLFVRIVSPTEAVYYIHADALMNSLSIVPNATHAGQFSVFGKTAEVTPEYMEAFIVMKLLPLGVK